MPHQFGGGFVNNKIQLFAKADRNLFKMGGMVFPGCVMAAVGTASLSVIY